MEKGPRERGPCEGWSCVEGANEEEKLQKKEIPHSQKRRCNLISAKARKIKLFPSIPYCF